MMRMLVATLVALIAAPALAQSPFANPFDTAAAYRSVRGDAPAAHFRLRYEVTRIEYGAPPVVSEMTVDVAPDWSLVREGDRAILRDYRLNRVFQLEGEHFTAMNAMAGLTFRVMERQNRSFLQGVLAAAGPKAPMTDACDADAELGLAIPSDTDVGKTELTQQANGAALRCNDRDIGGFVAGAGAAPPAAFWPTLFDEMTTHPALFHAVRDSGHAPARLETRFGMDADKASRRSWRLLGVETTATPWPLQPAMRNATADQIDALLAPGASKIAADAVAGRAQGGAPTLAIWSARLETLSRSDPAAAGLLLTSTFNMFPGVSDTCGEPKPNVACGLARQLQTIAATDPAPLALMEIVLAEGKGDAPAAIAAMKRAQASPHRDHPALGASFALAILTFKDEDVAAARAANLPMDVAALQTRAAMELPYNPGYWSDIGDRMGRNYRWDAALLFYDLAASLPVPGSSTDSGLMSAKRKMFERVRRDFPDASLPQ